MLAELRIEGLAIIDSLSIDFSEGFNVITGETGAGKSILIRALNFLLGGRAGTDVIRSGASQAAVTGQFRVPSRHEALRVLESLGIESEQEGEKFHLLIRRHLTNKGRAQAWINDTPVTTSALRDVGRTLIDLFAQHENQRLLESQRHLDYLDDFLTDFTLRDRLASDYEAVAQIFSRLETLLATYQSRTENLDYLQFRYEELSKLSPSVEDYETLRAQCMGTEKVEKLKNLVEETLRLIEPPGEGDVASRLFESNRKLSKLRDLDSPLIPVDEVLALQQRVEQTAHELQDFSYQLQKWMTQFDFDPSELERAQNRLWSYQELFRKHQVLTAEQLCERWDSLKKEMDLCSNAAEQAREILGEMQAATLQLKKSAQLLSQERRKCAKTLTKEVQKELAELAMPGAKFEVSFEGVNRVLPDLPLEMVDPSLRTQWDGLRSDLSQFESRGGEKVQFLLSANPGEPVMALDRVASGGELSRIMLAIKKALAADADTCVIVFDEIDTGISGRVADIVGRKMRELARNFQVICISHLPQVAVHADRHYLVQKSGKAKRTESTIVPLSSEQSAKEIARLLSGEELTQSSLQHARSLIEKAKKPSRPRAR